jgi:membrane protein required for colicin V production
MALVNWVDWTIMLFMVLTVLGGLTQGFFRSFCSLAGLLLGLVLAAWNYESAAALVFPLVRSQRAASAIGFLLIALVVMGLAALVGKILSRAFHLVGLGCLDKLAGAAFGFLQGAGLVMLAVLVTVAFFPKTQWLAEARLPRMFFGACHMSAQMSPAELADRVRKGLKFVEEESPQWLHSSHRGV